MDATTGEGTTRARAPEERSRVSGVVGLMAVVLALTSALATFLILAGATPILPTHEVVIWLLSANGVLVLLLLGVVAWETWSLLRARWAGAAGAGLHVRVVSFFTFIAAFPAIVVAIVATITLERGLDPWFTSSIKGLISNTVDIARAYRDLQCRTIARETTLMAADLDRARRLFDADRKLFHDFMNSRAVFLGFPVAMIVGPEANIIERIEIRPLEGLVPPTVQDVQEASDRDALCLVSSTGSIVRSVLRLANFDGAALYVARAVDPRTVEFLPAAEAGVAYYQALEQKKFGIQIAFASMFALVALIMLMSAVWLGLTFANRLVAPIRRLINATDQVATGNFYVQVPVRKAEGDLAHLGETFNKMTADLRRQRDSLVAASDLIDRRRRFTEAVLSGVSAGVIGLDGKARVSLCNPMAESLLVPSSVSPVGRPIEAVLPEIGPLVAEARSGRQRAGQGQILVMRQGRERTLNVRLTQEHARDGEEGFVVTLDDITDLVSAQRTSAWADVARRIAHEIKNPLTPIQLSAERIKRKYGKLITVDREVFDQCTDTIVRQVDDIKRMVDEFSSFARMPKPRPAAEDVLETARQVVFMMRVASPEIDFVEDWQSERLVAQFDRRLVSQALTNVVKNATEAIAAVPEGERGTARVTVRVRTDARDNVVIDVIDTGKGFPAENRQRLLEPYMTTREGGTGLGLPIVGKIFEDHGGGIELLDHPQAGEGARGACVRLWFPREGTDRKQPNAAPARAEGEAAGMRA